MGLTIHWDLKAPDDSTEANIKEVLIKLRDFALTLPVAEVSDVLYFEGDDTNYSKGPKDDPHKWLKIQAQNYDEQSLPDKFYAVSIWPGEGCEEANLGLAFYTDSQSWSWKSFCKTQYAEDFVGCHLAVITILDFCKLMGILQRVSDEGDYWESRDMKLLGENINESSTMIRKMADALKGISGGKVMSAIDESENYMDVK